MQTRPQIEHKSSESERVCGMNKLQKIKPLFSYIFQIYV
jgi:hypothetical protein